MNPNVLPCLMCLAKLELVFFLVFFFHTPGPFLSLIISWLITLLPGQACILFRLQIKAPIFILWLIPHGFLCWLVVQKNLEVGEVLAVDVSCIVALTTTVNVQIKYNGPMRRAVFGVSLCYPSFYFFFFLNSFCLIIKTHLCDVVSVLKNE